MKLTKTPAQVQMPELVGMGIASRAALLTALVAANACGQTPGTSTGLPSWPQGTSNASGPLSVPGYMNSSASPVAPPSLGGSPGESFRNLQGLPGNSAPYTAAPGAAGMIPQGLGIRWETGAVTFNSSIFFTYTDNALQGSSLQGKQEDFIILPMLGMTIFQQVSESAQLSFNVGVGYHYSLNFDDLAQINFAPNGTINYSFVVGDTLFTLFDRVSGNGGNRPEIAGNGFASGVDFNRINNQIGLSVTHAFTENTSESGMYGYTIDRGLNDQFGILDQDQHTVSAGLYQRLSPYWTAGISGQAVKTSFSQAFQNDSTTYGGGPMLSFQPNEFIAVSGAVQYTVSQFDTGGLVGDSSEFSGLTYQLSALHRITSNLRHSVTVASGVNSGLGSNFTETFSAAYVANWQFHERMGLNAGITYSTIKQSQAHQALIPITFPSGTILVPASFIANDEATLYDFNLSTGYQLTDRINLALAYHHSIRDSRFDVRSFSMNVVTLSVSYRF